MKDDLPHETGEPNSPGKFSERLLPAAAWVVALALTVVAAWGGLRLAQEGPPPGARPSKPSLPNLVEGGKAPKGLALPVVTEPVSNTAILRRPELHTTIPTRPRQDVITYTVEKGDSLFAIAKAFNLAPETVLWGNYELLNDNPDQLAIGMELVIPPADGVLYEWQPGDSIEQVAAQFKTSPAEILNWTGNGFDLAVSATVVKVLRTYPKIEKG